MDISLNRSATGRYETSVAGGETVRAFVPDPLPPEPPLDLRPLQEPLETAHLALGRLDSLTTLLPDPRLFIYTYVRKEAVLSSQIEGTQSSLSDLLLFELKEQPGVPMGDVVEVSSYVAALEYGLQRLRDDFPLSNRLIREIHGELLAHGRGSDKLPGEFRQSQNWFGGTRPGNAHYVPPPPHAVQECMGAWEQFLHSQESGLPILVRAGIAHVQFETIHPFLDGNGRVGRLLITFMLHHAGVLREPLLYLSLYMKQHRQQYYALLDGVRKDGDWEAWIRFFLDGVASTAEGAVATAQRLMALFQDDRDQVQQMGRASGSALRVHEALKERPITSITRVCQRTGLSFPAVSTAMARLIDLDLVFEITKGRRRDRLFAYKQYIAILSEGAEPL